MMKRRLVNNDFAMKLRGLEGYEIVFICDDSGSMTKPIGKSWIVACTSSFLKILVPFPGQLSDPFAVRSTRCKVLQRFEQRDTILAP